MQDEQSKSRSDEEHKTKFDDQVEKLVSMWEKDAIFGPEKISEQIRHIPKLHNKYFIHLSKARRELIRLKSELEDAELERTLYYTGRAQASEYKENPLNFTIPKGELPLWMKADGKIKKLNHKIECYKELIQTLSEIISQINNRSWALKSMLESQKFEAGLN
ncbi:single stranded DNA-binding protein [Agrobacterium phage Atu_ph04]|uniref:Single stranded DNA-binding protein n=1 Tax=Agrobacterium phage Atu_ph04 TaxID=2024263 RepID=A0A223W0H2_9CAUD|nr:UvsY-like recombination mediator [Agrobacterium phage Atu_ph04]ASV44627.1 single stranded DNA-binding protein [Agrobacterium phage Atu_ph04]